MPEKVRESDLREFTRQIAFEAGFTLDWTDKGAKTEYADTRRADGPALKAGTVLFIDENGSGVRVCSCAVHINI